MEFLILLMLLLIIYITAQIGMRLDKIIDLLKENKNE